ncbi:DUF2304 family protein [Nitrosopumilus sp. S4]
MFIVSIFAIIILIKIKRDSRLGNEFFTILTIFWSIILLISSYPSILDSVLNNTGFVNKSQFLLSLSVAIIFYLLVNQSRKSKLVSQNLSNTIRTIALKDFKTEIKEKNPKVVIVIVAKNEEKTIGTIIDKIKSQNFPFTYQIIVVNDGSTDNTEKITRGKKTLVITHYHNLGVGGANKTGYLSALQLRPEIIVNIDGDGQHDPSYIIDLVKKIDEGFDMVYGSRFSDTSKYKTNSVRLVGNKFYTNLVNRIGGISITDVTSGFRALRTDKIKSVYYIAETNFAIELALRAAKNKLQITEIPIKAEMRIHGKSQFHRIEKFFEYNINALTQIFNAYFRQSDFSKF